MSSNPVSYFMIALGLWFILGLSPAGIKLKYRRKNKKQELIITINLLWGLLKKTIHFPRQQPGDSRVEGLVPGGYTGEGKDDWKKVYYFLRSMPGMIKKNDKTRFLVRLAARGIRCRRLTWETSIGLNDAAQTGIAAGGIWGIKTSIIGVLSRWISLKGCRLSPRVNPLYGNKHFHVFIEGEFCLRLYQLYLLVIIAGYLKY